MPAPFHTRDYEDTVTDVESALEAAWTDWMAPYCPFTFFTLWRNEYNQPVETETWFPGRMVARYGVVPDLSFLDSTFAVCSTKDAFKDLILTTHPEVFRDDYDALEVQAARRVDIAGMRRVAAMLGAAKQSDAERDAASDELRRLEAHMMQLSGGPPFKLVRWSVAQVGGELAAVFTCATRSPEGVWSVAAPATYRALDSDEMRAAAETFVDSQTMGTDAADWHTFDVAHLSGRKAELEEYLSVHPVVARLMADAADALVRWFEELPPPPPPSSDDDGEEEEEEEEEDATEAGGARSGGGSARGAPRARGAPASRRGGSKRGGGGAQASTVRTSTCLALLRTGTKCSKPCAPATSIWCACDGDACLNTVRKHAGRVCGQAWHIKCLGVFAPEKGVAVDSWVCPLCAGSVPDATVALVKAARKQRR